MTLALEIGFMAYSIGLRPRILIADDVRKKDWYIGRIASARNFENWTTLYS